MSSEAITQNDLREILSRTVGAVPSEYKKLLWTNPNPSVAFGAQTVVSGIDVSAYDDIEVIIKANINVGIGKSNIFKYASAGTWAVSGPPTVNDTWVGVRRVTINATSISFGNGGYAYWSSTSANYAHNDYAIPLAVYGIKYERVAPPQIDNTLEVASGTVDHSGFNAVTVAGASSSYKTISFGKTFSQIPQVVVQEHNNSLNNYGGVNTSVSYVTTTGFNLYVHGVPQATLSGLAYDWIAMTQIGE